MAWDIFFDQTWTDRINAEDKTMMRKMKAETHHVNPPGKSRTRVHQVTEKFGPYGDKPNTPPGPDEPKPLETLTTWRKAQTMKSSQKLSRAGTRTLSPREMRASSSSDFRASRSMKRSVSTPSSVGSVTNVVPEETRGLARFPIGDKDVLTARVEAFEGKIPRIRMRTLNESNSQSKYTRYVADFCFEEPPPPTPIPFKKSLIDPETGVVPPNGVVPAWMARAAANSKVGSVPGGCPNTDVLPDQATRQAKDCMHF